MTKQDWCKAEDYNYTKDLDNKGWAWEFIRRRDDYRKKYAEWQSLIAKKYRGDWSKEEPIEVFVNTSGLSAAMIHLKQNAAKFQRKRTASQQVAANWGLWAMYDPALKYDPGVMKFDLFNPFPTFYADLAEPRFARPGCEQIQPYINLFMPKPLMTDADIIVVAFDTRRPIAAQIAKARKMLTELQDEGRMLVQKKKPQKAGLSLYLRMLDAVEADSELTPSKIVKIIDPNKKFKGTGGYDMADYKQINQYGEDTLASARAFRDEGYMGLLFKIRNTD